MHRQDVTDDRVIAAFERHGMLLRIAEELGISKASAHHRCKSLGLKFVKQIPLEDILEGKHQNYDRGHLKRRLLQSGMLKNECEECRITEYNGKPIVMQLDHIDGNPKNNVLSNLRMLCPNCHSQTETFSRGHKKLKKV